MNIIVTKSDPMNISYTKHKVIQEDISTVVQTLESDFITQGPIVKEFEDDFARYIGSKYAISTCNGTAALHLCNLVLKTNSHSKVLTTPITFMASSNSVLYCGGKVEFVDINTDTYLMDVESLKKKLQQNKKGTYSGLILVDFAGLPLQMEKYREIADEYNLWIIEDACHALGGNFLNSAGVMHQSGDSSYADLSIFSFHPAKHITSGEGGMITTNSKNLYEELLKLREHGIIRNHKLPHKEDEGWYYDMQNLGYNYRLSDINASLGNSQLKRIQENLQKRREIAQKYNQSFDKIKEIQTPFVPNQVEHAYHLYVILVENRKEIYNYLKTKGIYTQVHYIPIYKFSYYQKMGYQENDFPNTEVYYSKCLSLPMYPSLLDEEQEYVIECVEAFYENSNFNIP